MELYACVCVYTSVYANIYSLALSNSTEETKEQWYLNSNDHT